jgi:hypothetical protein
MEKDWETNMNYEEEFCFWEVFREIFETEGRI